MSKYTVEDYQKVIDNINKDLSELEGIYYDFDMPPKKQTTPNDMICLGHLVDLRTPKKVITYRSFKGCPHCGTYSTVYSHYKFKHCIECGGALDWSDSE